MLKSEFPVEAIIIFVKSIKKRIQWYIHFIQKSVILFAINLPLTVSKPTLCIFSLPHGGGGSTRNRYASLIITKKQNVIIRILLYEVIYTSEQLE